MSPPLISAEGVGRVHARGSCVALRDVSVAIARGEHVAITGPSGSGKSTLLHVLCGIDRPTSGRVLFAGSEPRGAAAWAALRARSVGFVFQSFNLLPTLTAAQNVEVPMFGVVRAERDRRRRAEELLARVGLTARRDHRPGELSGGEKQRLAIARSLANRPEVVLADEPTGNLDSRTAGEILDLFTDVCVRDGTTLVVVTHDATVAARARRIVAMCDGQIVPAS